MEYMMLGFFGLIGLFMICFTAESLTKIICQSKPKPQPKCNHKWVMVDKTVIKSGHEVMAEHGGSFDGRINPKDMLTSSINIIMKCETCGELKQFEHYNII